jgi:hypothetical protein
LKTSTRRLCAFARVALVIALTQACAGGSPSEPAPAIPDFHGQFTGTYIINSCSEIGAFFSGFCAGSGWNVGTFPFELSLVQSQTAVTGTITLSRGGGSPLSGAFQGVVQPTGHLTATAALPPLQLFGAVSRDIIAWDTTISGSALNGAFTLVHRSSTESATMTVSASLLQAARRP